MSDRIANPQLRDKVMTAEEAVQFVNRGDKVGTSGFTGAGYPKAVPGALARRMTAATAAGDRTSATPTACRPVCWAVAWHACGSAS